MCLIMNHNTVCWALIWDLLKLLFWKKAYFSDVHQLMQSRSLALPKHPCEDQQRGWVGKIFTCTFNTSCIANCNKAWLNKLIKINSSLLWFIHSKVQIILLSDYGLNISCCCLFNRISEIGVKCHPFPPPFLPKQTNKQKKTHWKKQTAH